MNLETNIGTALYVLSEVKGFYSNTGGDTQIVISDEKGFREISIREHQKYYNIFINNLSHMFDKSFTDPTKNKEILKKIFPVIQTTIL